MGRPRECPTAVRRNRLSSVLVDVRCLLVRCLRFANVFKGLIRRGYVRHRLTHSSPALTAIGINQKRRAKGNVGATVCRPATFMQQSVFANDLCARIAEDSNFLPRCFIPNCESMLLIIHTDGDQLNPQPLQLFTLPRELAQFCHAVWSPIPAIKEQQDPVPTLVGKLKCLARLVIEREVRRRLALGRGYLRLRIWARLPARNRTRQGHCPEQQPTRNS